MLVELGGATPTGPGLGGVVGLLIVGPFGIGGFFAGVYLYSGLADRLGGE